MLSKHHVSIKYTVGENCIERLVKAQELLTHFDIISSYKKQCKAHFRSVEHLSYGLIFRL